MRNWLNDLKNSSIRCNIPIMTHPGIEHINKHVIDAVTNGEIHYQAIKKVIDLYQTEVCTSIMDLTVEAEALGCHIEFSENDLPNVTGRLVDSKESIEKLRVPNLTDSKRQLEYLKANKLALANIDKPMLSGCIGPFSLAGRLYGVSDIMVGIYIEPEAITILLEKCTEYILQYCKALKDMGATGVIMAEPAAGLLSDEDCMLYSSIYVKRIVDALQDDQFTIVLHNCGNTGQCTNAMIKSDANALHFGNAIDMLATLKECPSDLIVMGNIDPVGVMQQKKPEEVKQITYNLLEQTANYSNFVLSTGCEVPPFVPEENIIAYFEAVKEFNEKK